MCCWEKYLILLLLPLVIHILNPVVSHLFIYCLVFKGHILVLLYRTLGSLFLGPPGYLGGSPSRGNPEEPTGPTHQQSWSSFSSASVGTFARCACRTRQVPYCVWPSRPHGQEEGSIVIVILWPTVIAHLVVNVVVVGVVVLSGTVVVNSIIINVVLVICIAIVVFVGMHGLVEEGRGRQ